MQKQLSSQERRLISHRGRLDPEWWIKNIFSIKQFSPGQKEILAAIPRAYEENKTLVVPSGHAQGKDFIAGCLAPWFLYNHVPSKVIFTAPTDRQVKKIMWAEMLNRLNNATFDLGGTILTCNIQIQEDWFLLGFTTKETGNTVGKFQGFHSPHVFVIASEAQAIPDTIYTEIDGILTNNKNLFLMIGNPLRTVGRFAREIKNTTDNIVISLDVLDSPNYKERRIVIPGMAAYEWVEKKRKAWGEDSPMWYARVLGKLPKHSIDTVFTQSIIDHILNIDPNASRHKSVVAQDVARFGDDENVTYGGKDGKVVQHDIVMKNDIPEAANRVAVMRSLINANRIVIDADGLGSGVVDILRRMEIKDCYIDEIHGGGKPEDEETYVNLRAEMIFHAKHQAELGLCSIPNDDLLIEELLEIRYFFNNKGKIQIEKKEDIKERLGRSPDRADAWILLQWGFRNAEPIRKPGVWSQRDDNASVSTAVSGAMTG